MKGIKMLHIGGGTFPDHEADARSLKEWLRTGDVWEHPRWVWVDRPHGCVNVPLPRRVWGAELDL